MSRSRLTSPLIGFAPIAALLVLAAIAGTMRLRAYDLFWHLATGRWILEHRALPETDPFRFTSEAAPWVNHEWLFQVAQRLVELAGGLDALVIARSIVAVGLAALLYHAFRRAGTPAAGATVIAAVALLGARPRMMMRPELASLVALPVMLALLQSYRRTRSWRPFFWMVILVVVWANLHAGVLIAPIVAGAYLIGARLPGGNGAGRGGETSLPWGRVGLVPAALALAVALNPHGIDIYRVPFRIARALEGVPVVNPEWLPAWAAPQPALIIGMIGLAALAAWTALESRRIDPATGLATVALAALAVSGVRHQGLFFLGAAFFAAECVSDLTRRHAKRAQALEGVQGAMLATVVCLLVSGWCLFPPPSGPLRPRQGPYSFGLGLEPGRFPVDAAEQIARRPELGAMYNDVAFGGYLTWRLYPPRQVFIDGRNEVNPELLREVAAARSDSRRWDDLLGRFDIDVALVRYDDRLRQVLTPGSSPDGKRGVTYHTTNALLFPASRFALVYWDDQAMMFVRRTPDRGSWLARDEYRF
ncbi:MAG: hypothetical protein R3344_05615, partial [Acidobacteriota bacterium]|nr:hypothetical protein [Acidobacteriota bacterium]